MQESLLLLQQLGIRGSCGKEMDGDGIRERSGPPSPWWQWGQSSHIQIQVALAAPSCHPTTACKESGMGPGMIPVRDAPGSEVKGRICPEHSFFFLFPAFLCSSVEAGLGIESPERSLTGRQMRQQNQGIMEWFGKDHPIPTPFHKEGHF